MRFAVWFVYRLVHRQSGLIYFGSTKSPSERFHAHRFGRKSGAPKIAAAIKLYGIDAFEFEMVAWFTDKLECLSHEKKMIRQHDTIWPNGFNLVGGGRGSLTPNLTSKRRGHLKRQSNAFWGNPENRRRHKEAMKKSPACRAAQKENIKALQKWRADPKNAEVMRQSKLGHTVSKETREKIGNANRGKVRSAETRRKLSLAHRRLLETPIGEA